MFKKIWILIFIFSIYISANNYLSSATCSSRTYHKLKNELNLDKNEILGEEFLFKKEWE